MFVVNRFNRKNGVNVIKWNTDSILLCKMQHLHKKPPSFAGGRARTCIFDDYCSEVLRKYRMHRTMLTKEARGVARPMENSVGSARRLIR